MERVLRGGGTLRIEVVGQHVHHRVVDVERPEVVVQRLDRVEVAEVEAELPFDFRADRSVGVLGHEGVLEGRFVRACEREQR